MFLTRIRIYTLDIARDAGIEISNLSAPRFHCQSRFPTVAMDILVCLIAFHCLSSTFHCYLTYDPDYFRGADQFPGWDSLCLDHVPDFGCVQVSRMCHRSRIPIMCLLMCDLRSAHNPCFRVRSSPSAPSRLSCRERRLRTVPNVH